MTAHFDHLLTGKRPKEDILDLVQREMETRQYPINQPFQLQFHQGPLHIDEGITFHTVGQAIDAKLHFCALTTAAQIFGEPHISQRDPRLEKMKNLIVYWYAQGWLPPIPDYQAAIQDWQNSLPTGKISDPDDMRRVLQMDLNECCDGLPPAPMRIDSINSYMEFVGSQSMGGSIAFNFVHGAGPITGQESPVQQAIQVIRGAGAKLAKSECGLESAQTDRERQQAYETGMGLILYWVMKKWVEVPIRGKARHVFVPTDEMIAHHGGNRFPFPLPSWLGEDHLRDSLTRLRKEKQNEEEILDSMAQGLLQFAMLLGQTDFRREDLRQLCAQYIKWFDQHQPIH